MTPQEVSKLIQAEGLQPTDFHIIITDNGYSYYPKFDLDIRDSFEEEDNTVKAEVALISAISNLEMLQLLQTTKEQLGTDQAMANLESLMFVSELQGKIAALETEIAELKGGDK